jgi:hypothetical protein
LVFVQAGVLAGVLWWQIAVTRATRWQGVLSAGLVAAITVAAGMQLGTPWLLLIPLAGLLLAVALFAAPHDSVRSNEGL